MMSRITLSLKRSGDDDGGGDDADDFYYFSNAHFSGGTGPGGPRTIVFAPSPAASRVGGGFGFGYGYGYGNDTPPRSWRHSSAHVQVYSPRGSPRASLNLARGNINRTPSPAAEPSKLTLGAAISRSRSRSRSRYAPLDAPSGVKIAGAGRRRSNSRLSVPTFLTHPLSLRHTHSGSLGEAVPVVEEYDVLSDQNAYELRKLRAVGV